MYNRFCQTESLELDSYSRLDNRFFTIDSFVSFTHLCIINFYTYVNHISYVHVRLMSLK